VTLVSPVPSRAPSVPAATALVIFSVCCFGSISIIATLATRDGAALLALLTWRYIAALAGLFAIAGGAIVRESPRRAWPIVVLGGGTQALVAYLTLAALDYLSAATLGFLFYTYPAWVAVIAAVRRKEALTPTRLGALALSLIGITVMVGSPWAEPIPFRGLLLALSGAVIYAAYIPLIDHLQRGVKPAVAAAYISVGAGSVFMAAIAVTGRLADLILPTPVAWACAVALGILCTTIAFVTFLRALPVLGSVRTAIVSTVEPFWTALAGAVVLGQSITPGTIAGGALIAAAVVLLQKKG
jgi:drug/metabolite transporter (DMT)-like permease